MPVSSRDLAARQPGFVDPPRAYVTVLCPTTLAAAYDPCRRDGLRDPEDQFDSDGQEALVALMRRPTSVQIGWWVRHVRADARHGDRRAGLLDQA